MRDPRPPWESKKGTFWFLVQEIRDTGFARYFFLQKAIKFINNKNIYLADNKVKTMVFILDGNSQ